MPMPPPPKQSNPAKEIADQLEGLIFYDRGNLQSDFELAALKRGWTKADAQQLFDALPSELQQATTMTARIDQKRRYFFGGVYDVGAGPRIIGTDQFPEVERLFECVSRFYELGDNLAWRSWIAKLGNIEKHASALTEVEPLLCINRVIPVVNEIPGAKGTIDWQFTLPDGRYLRLEVKLRERDVIEFFSQLNSGTNETQTVATLPEILFRDTERKFFASDPTQCLQGVWIQTSIAADEAQLLAYFAQLDPAKVHFAIFPMGPSAAFVLSRRDADREFVLSFFGFEFSRYFLRS